MSTVEDSGLAASEHKPEPTDAAGCKSEVDRSVSWTDQRSGFAELRARCTEYKKALDDSVKRHKARGSTIIAGMDACGSEVLESVLRWIDALEADAKDACTRREEPDFNGPSS